MLFGLSGLLLVIYSIGSVCVASVCVASYVVMGIGDGFWERRFARA